MPLGKSLGNILGDYFGEEEMNLDTELKLALSEEKNPKILNIPIRQIEANPYQTRTNFDDKKIINLSKDIAKNGLIHPIVLLKKTNFEGRYQLLAGERRLKAVTLLGETEILAIIKSEDSFSPSQQAMLSAMENIQREDLGAFELAKTFKMLIDTQDLTEESLANILGYSSQYVKNYLRLLTLSNPVQQALINKQIGEGQARHLVGLEESTQELILKQILAKDLTVKEVLKLVQKIQSQVSTTPSLKLAKNNLPSEIFYKVDKIASLFPNSKMQCVGDLEKGKIVIKWGN